MHNNNSFNNTDTKNQDRTTDKNTISTVDFDLESKKENKKTLSDDERLDISSLELISGDRKPRAWESTDPEIVNKVKCMQRYVEVSKILLKRRADEKRKLEEKKEEQIDSKVETKSDRNILFDFVASVIFSATQKRFNNEENKINEESKMSEEGEMNEEKTIDEVVIESANDDEAVFKCENDGEITIERENDVKSIEEKNNEKSIHEEDNDRIQLNIQKNNDEASMSEEQVIAILLEDQNNDEVSIEKEIKISTKEENNDKASLNEEQIIEILLEDQDNVETSIEEKKNEQITNEEKKNVISMNVKYDLEFIMEKNNDNTSIGEEQLIEILLEEQNNDVVAIEEEKNEKSFSKEDKNVDIIINEPSIEQKIDTNIMKAENNEIIGNEEKEEISSVDRILFNKEDTFDEIKSSEIFVEEENDVNLVEKECDEIVFEKKNGEQSNEKKIHYDSLQNGEKVSLSEYCLKRLKKMSSKASAWIRNTKSMIQKTKFYAKSIKNYFFKGEEEIVLPMRFFENQGKRVFSTRSLILLKRHFITKVILHMIQYVDKNIKNEQFLFRKSGRDSRIKKLSADISQHYWFYLLNLEKKFENMEIDVDALDDDPAFLGMIEKNDLPLTFKIDPAEFDIRDVISVLKKQIQFDFRGLFTDEQANLLFKIFEKKEKAQKEQPIEVAEETEMPEHQKECLKYIPFIFTGERRQIVTKLFALFRKIDSLKSHTRMSVKDLSICTISLFFSETVCLNRNSGTKKNKWKDLVGCCRRPNKPPQVERFKLGAEIIEKLVSIDFGSVDNQFLKELI